MTRVLVVEDDAEIGSLLQEALGAAGYEVSWARTGADALRVMGNDAADLVLLDLGLPDRDGLSVCRRLKAQHPGTVVVMLTARQEEMDVIAGLDAGGDDYLVKPFRTTELLARVRAHLRRVEPVRGDSRPIYRVGDLELDPRSRRCTLGGIEVALRTKEFDLLSRLLASTGEAVTREQLMSDVWDEHWFGSTKTLDVHVAALRSRLSQAADDRDPQALVPAITTLRGHGYRLEPPLG